MASSLPLTPVSYNCRGWNSGRILICDLSECFVQEHWLLNSQLVLSPSLLNSVLLVCLTWMIHYFMASAASSCQIVIHLPLLSIGNLVLCICVYFPANYHHIQSSDAFLNILCEIEGFIDTVSFDH